uniref:Uncharacterized protein n=1 Tax=Panagrolaimus davidi TaxID=227884 RepID=A0A914Q6V3_9BILA
MTPLSQRKVAERHKDLLFLSILKDFYPRILTSFEKLPVWKEVLDECRKNGICDDQSARYLGRTRWPALLRATTKKWKHRHKKQLNKKDELIIEIERMRIPDFCFPLNDDEEKEGKPKENVAAANKLAPVFEFYNSDNVFANELAADDPMVNYHAIFIDNDDLYVEEPAVNDLMAYDPDDIQYHFNDSENVFAEEYVDNSQKELAGDDPMVDNHAKFIDNDDVYVGEPAVNDMMAYDPDDIHDNFNNGDNVFANELAADDLMVNYHAMFIDNDDLYVEESAVNDLMAYGPDDIQYHFNNSGNIFANELAADDPIVDYHTIFIGNDDLYVEEPAVNDLMAYDPDDIQDNFNDNGNVFAEEYDVDNSKKELAADDIMVDNHAKFIDNDDVYVEKPAVNDLMAYDPDDIQDNFNDNGNVSVGEYVVDNSISNNPIDVQNEFDDSDDECFDAFSSTTGLPLPMLFLPESFKDYRNHGANGIQSTDVHDSNLQNDFYPAGIRFLDLYAEYGQLKLNMMRENLANSDNNL